MNGPGLAGVIPTAEQLKRMFLIGLVVDRGLARYTLNQEPGPEVPNAESLSPEQRSSPRAGETREPLQKGQVFSVVGHLGPFRVGLKQMKPLKPQRYDTKKRQPVPLNEDPRDGGF